MATYYKTTIVFEVLHDEPLPDDLGNIVAETVNGQASGDIKSEETVEVSREEMAELLMDQRSDPEFFVLDWENE